MQIGVITTSRADYGILRPLLRKIIADDGLELNLYVSGSHLSDSQGYTVDEIYKDEIPISAEVCVPEYNDEPQSIAKRIAETISAFADVFAGSALDMLVVMGDRYEMFAAATASIPFNIPLAHLHGGELTFGSHDDIYRHALSKMAHLHFTSTQVYRNRLIQMGEQPQRVVHSGALSMDNILEVKTLSLAELQKTFDLSWQTPPILVSLHPESHSDVEPEQFAECLLESLKTLDDTIIFTQPNSDSGGIAILEKIKQFVNDNSNAYFVKSFGLQGYFSMMQQACCMVGNSSSGIVEAPFFGLPVVNIGSRQDGRVKAPDIIEVGANSADITDAIHQAKNTDKKPAYSRSQSPYRDGKAAQIIVNTLKNCGNREDLLVKRFHDL